MHPNIKNVFTVFLIISFMSINVLSTNSTNLDVIEKRQDIVTQGEFQTVNTKLNEVSNQVMSNQDLMHFFNDQITGTKIFLVGVILLVVGIMIVFNWLFYRNLIVKTRKEIYRVENSIKNQNQEEDKIIKKPEKTPVNDKVKIKKKGDK